MGKAKSKSLSETIWIKLIYILIASLVFGPLLSISPGVSGVRLYISDVLAFFITILWFPRVGDIGKIIKSNLLAQYFSLFFCIACLSLILSPMPLTGLERFISFLYLIRALLYTGVGLTVVQLTKKSLIHPSSVISYLITAGVVVAFFGWLQYFLYDDLRNLYYLGWDPHYKRIFSFYFDPNYFGLLLVLTFLALLSRMKNKFKDIFLALFLFITIAFTYSRSTYVSLIGSTILFSILKKKMAIAGSILVLLILAIFALPRPSGEGVRLERVFSITERIESYKLATRMFFDHPILGIGFNAVRYAKKVYGYTGENLEESHSGAGFDSSLLFVLATTGIIGTGAFLMVLWKLLEKRSRLFVVSLIAILIHSFFLNSLFYPWVMLWIAILTADNSTSSLE
jgi:O-antigen ligase